MLNDCNNNKDMLPAVIMEANGSRITRWRNSNSRFSMCFVMFTYSRHLEFSNVRTLMSLSSYVLFSNSAFIYRGKYFSKYKNEFLIRSYLNRMNQVFFETFKTKL